MAMAVARDRWHGDAMARVMALVMMFFMLAPAVAPLFGQAILALGPWEAIFVFMALVGVALGVWSYRFEETLAPADRIPLTFERTRRSAGIVVGSRWAMGHGLLVMFEMGAFVTYLGSSELIFDDVFDRGDQFAFFFAGGALVMAASNLAVSRLIPRLGTERVMLFITVGYVVAAGLFLLLTASAGGSPSFWWWIAVLVVLNALHSVILPTANSLAMQPLGRFAGTGSGIIGTLSTVGGAVLASVVSATVDGSATPLSVAYFVFGTAALASLLWGRAGSSSALGS
jgi:DHA1 family bicyclomycin/chloramphenicol resistance-like MFS transporter